MIKKHKLKVYEHDPAILPLGICLSVIVTVVYKDKYSRVFIVSFL